MAVTKEDVLARAKELSLTLNETEVDKFVTDGKLPEETSDQRYQRMKKELEAKSQSELIQMVLDARSEAKDRRLETKEIKGQFDEMGRKLQEMTEKASKYPELQEQYNGLQSSVQVIKDSEKKRREAALSKLEESKRTKLAYLLEVDKVGGDQFDETLEMLTTKKSDGHAAPSPGGGPTEVNPFSKKTFNLTEQARLKKTDPEKAKKLQEDASKEK